MQNQFASVREAAVGPRTLHAKLWDLHRIDVLEDGSDLLHIDRIMLHERSGARSFRSVAKAGREVFDPTLIFGTMDHVLDTRPGRTDETLIPGGKDQILAFRESASKAGISLFDVGDPRQGIAHVTMPEQGLALPGLSVICADSHTPTLGGLGALAWGVGASETEHAIATQSLNVVRPKTMRVSFEGRPGERASAKDMILALIAKISNTGAVGYMVEFAGPAVRALSVEGRMTLCNMGVEFGAWSAIVAPDDTVFDFLAGRPFAPQGEAWTLALAHWRTLFSDDEAIFDSEITLDVASLSPQVSWGTNPGQVVALGDKIPETSDISDPVTRGAAEKALDYMGLKAGQSLEGIPIDAVFIGSCTNARLSDLRAAAELLRGRHIAPSIAKAIVVPGSMEVKRLAELEKLDQIFSDAGFEWREPGCSLCFFGGGEGFPPGSRVASTTNRNFENRQGRGIRTHIMSPASAAAAAVTGTLTDPRKIAL